MAPKTVQRRASVRIGDGSSISSSSRGSGTAPASAKAKGLARGTSNTAAAPSAPAAKATMRRASTGGFPPEQAQAARQALRRRSSIAGTVASTVSAVRKKNKETMLSPHKELPMALPPSPSSETRALDQPTECRSAFQEQQQLDEQLQLKREQLDQLEQRLREQQEQQEQQQQQRERQQHEQLSVDDVSRWLASQLKRHQAEDEDRLQQYLQKQMLQPASSSVASSRCALPRQTPHIELAAWWREDRYSPSTSSTAPVASVPQVAERDASAVAATRSGVPEASRMQQGLPLSEGAPELERFEHAPRIFDMAESSYDTDAGAECEKDCRSEHSDVEVPGIAAALRRIVKTPEPVRTVPETYDGLPVFPTTFAIGSGSNSADASGDEMGSNLQAQLASLRRENEELRRTLRSSTQRLQEMEDEKKTFFDEGIYDVMNSMWKQSQPRSPVQSADAKASQEAIIQAEAELKAVSGDLAALLNATAGEFMHRCPGEALAFKDALLALQEAAAETPLIPERRFSKADLATHFVAEEPRAAA